MINKVAVIGHDKIFFSLLEKNLLRINPEMVCLEFNDGLETITYCLRNKELPELIFTELFLNKIDGITLTDYISVYLPGIRVVCVVDEFDDSLVGNMAEVGAVALMSKSDVGRLFRIMPSNDGIYRIVNADLNEMR
jgi:DNA-binding NarL/FixJ family response regulator